MPERRQVSGEHSTAGQEQYCRPEQCLPEDTLHWGIRQSQLQVRTSIQIDSQLQVRSSLQMVSQFQVSTSIQIVPQRQVRI